jgi:tetratricopeptide (TPR) repeat protein
MLDDDRSAPEPSILPDEPTPAKRRDRQTEPSLRTPPDREQTDLSRHAPPPDGFLASLRESIARQKTALVAALIGWIWALALLAVLVLSGPVGIPPGDLLAFQQHLDNERFAEAETVLAAHAARLPEELNRAAAAMVLARKQAAVARLVAEAEKAYGDKAFAEALAKCTLGRTLAGDDATLLFLAAESLRQLGRLPEASPHYATFIERFADDGRIDDALFWQAEASLAGGRHEEARGLYARVAAMGTSNFRRSAERRVGELAALAPPAAGAATDAATPTPP